MSEESPPAEGKKSKFAASHINSTVEIASGEVIVGVSTVHVGEPSGNAASAIMDWGLPPLQNFTGKKENDEDDLKQFVREFERPWRLDIWNGEVYLAGRALRMYESLNDEQRDI